MSSVSASDRNNQTDEVRRIREDYENKEAEETKKKNKEIKNLTKKQDEELDKVHSEYDDQLKTLRGKHAELMDERDRRHTEDVSKMREMYLDSLRKKSTDDVRERDAIKDAFEGDLKKQKDITTSQREVDSRGFKESLAERDRVLEDRQTRGVVSLQEGLQTRTDHLNEKHKEELKAVVEDRDRRVGDLQRDVERMKDTYADGSAKDSRDRRAQDDRRTAAFETIYRNQEHNNNELLANRDAILKESHSHNNQMLNERLQKESDKMEALRNRYADEMDTRSGNQIKEARTEMMQAKNDQILDAITNRRLRDLDHNHLVSSYQAREDDLQRQKEQIFDKANETARERVNTVLDRTSKLVSDANRKNRMEQGIQDMRMHEAMGQQENTAKDQIALTNNRTEQRVRKIMQATNTAQKSEVRQHEENLEGLRHNYADNLQNQREAQLESVQKIYSRMDQKLRDLEAHLTKKHDDAVEYYETKIDELESQRKKDMITQNKDFETKNNQREKAVKMEEDALTQKYEQKMAIQEDLHQKELNRLEKRHQEQVQSVVARTAAQAKKA